MASEKEEIQDLQTSILQKLDGKTVEEHLEFIKAPTSQHLSYFSYDNIAYFRDALIGQPIYILDVLSENKLFRASLLKAAEILSELILDSTLKEATPFLLEKMQPLIDLFYYLNKIDFMDVLFEIEVIKAIALDIQASKLTSYPSSTDLLDYRDKVGKQIYYKIQMMTQREILSSELEQLNPYYMELLDASMHDDGSVNFKTLFLKLFKNDPELQDLCIAIRNAKQWPIDWPIVLRRLSEYAKDEPSKVKIVSLRERIKFFTHVLVFTDALKPIPKISDLELPAASIESVSTPIANGSLDIFAPQAEYTSSSAPSGSLETLAPEIELTPDSMLSKSLDTLASKEYEKEALKSIPLQKFGDITMPKVLEKLDLVRALRSKDASDCLYKAIACFCNALNTQPAYILDELSKNKIFIAWLKKAANSLSELSLNTSIFNPDFQKGIQPLIDLLYYFNKVNSTIESVLFRFYLVKLLTQNSGSNFEEDHIRNAILFHNTLIGQPIYILDNLCSNELFATWFRGAENSLLSLFSNPSIFNPVYQKKIQPFINLFYYFNKIDPDIKTLLYRFEVIKLLSEKDKFHSERNYIDIYNAYFKERINNDVFHPCIQSVSQVMDIALSNALLDPRFKLRSQLERACFTAWLIPHIKSQPGFTAIDEIQLSKVTTYLDQLHNQFFSRRAVTYTYGESSSANESLKDLFTEAKNIVNKFLQSINTSFYSEFHKESELKTFFLSLFTQETILNFFSPPKYQIVADVENTDDVYIDWHYVLTQLLAEIEKSPVDESDVVHLSNFIKKQEEILRVKIPALSALDTNMENIENESSRSMKPCAL